MSPPRLAVIADVQYGDQEPRRGRVYRAALGHLERVLAALRAAPLDLLVQLGDLIEGDREDPGASSADLERVLAPLERAGPPLVHVVGNHCLRVGRGPLEARLGLGVPWYARRLQGWRLVVLDTTERSRAGRAPDDPIRREAEAWLAAHPREQHPRARPYNGALGPGQLTWLEAELALAGRAGERVAVLGHHPLHPGAARENYLCLNGEQVCEVLEASPAVVAYLAGHDHAGGYVRAGGVHHLTLPAVLEGAHGALLELHPDRIELSGIGAVADRTMARA